DPLEARLEAVELAGFKDGLAVDQVALVAVKRDLRRVEARCRLAHRSTIAAEPWEQTGPLGREAMAGASPCRRRVLSSFISGGILCRFEYGAACECVGLALGRIVLDL